MCAIYENRYTLYMYENIKHGDKKMGFLIFAYRKLLLQRQINEMSYRQMQLSEQQQAITEKIGLVQQSLSHFKNAANIFTSSMMTSMQSNFIGENGQLDQTGFFKMQQEQMKITMANTIMNSVFEQTSKAQEAPLHAIDTQISQEMKSLESQLTLKQKELESVEKAEDQAAKSMTPKFGLGG